MNYQLLIAYILSVSIFIITPGPVLALVLKNATGGLNKALLTIIGTNLASLILISIAIAMIYGIIAIAENRLAQLAFCERFLTCINPMIIYKISRILVMV